MPTPPGFRIGWRRRPDLLLLDLEDDEGLDGLRRLRARPGLPLPMIALVPSGRPDLRLAALGAGADDAAERDTTARFLQARVRSLLRQRDDTLGVAPAEGMDLAWSGLVEAPAAFAPASPKVPPAPIARVALLSAHSTGAVPPPNRSPASSGPRWTASAPRVRWARSTGPPTTSC